MAYGMLVIAAGQGETERVISEDGCGVCSKIGNANELSLKIKEVVKADVGEMGSREYFEIHFNKKMLMDQMDDYFK